MNKAVQIAQAILLEAEVLFGIIAVSTCNCLELERPVIHAARCMGICAVSCGHQLLEAWDGSSMIHQANPIHMCNTAGPPHVQAAERAGKGTLREREAGLGESSVSHGLCGQPRTHSAPLVTTVHPLSPLSSICFSARAVLPL